MTKFYNRVVSKRVSQKWVQALGPEKMNAAEISGNRGERWKFDSYTRYQYPEYDVCKDPFTDENGDIVQHDIFLADQVWEHLDFPYRATKNIHAMLKPGGYFWLATPFYVKYHLAPHDCSRWSARGLKNLLIECGFDENEIQSEQWGNRECAKREMGKRWAVYERGVDSLENDPNFPVMSWALGRKTS